jgi:hypothetical protein
MHSQEIGNLLPIAWETLSSIVAADGASSSVHLLLQRERWYYPMKTDLSSLRFNVQKWQLMMTILVLFFMIVGTILAMTQHLPTDANEQGISSGPQAFLMNGTVISPPTVLFALFVLFTGLAFLASRARWAGLVGTIGVSLLSLVALLATTTDDHWRQLLNPAHFDLVKSPLVLTSSLALLLTALFGILTIAQGIRMRSQETHR